MGFVKVPNDLTKWAWYDDNNTLAVYVRVLLGAVWKDRIYQNVQLKRGQIATTIPQIAQQSKLTVQQKRTIINRLKSTGKITVETTPKFSVITLIDYDIDSFSNSQNNSQITDNQQTSNRQATDEQQSINRPTYIQKYRNTERHKDRNTEVVTASSASPTTSETITREFLVEEYGEKVVSAYEKKFDAWKAKKGGIVKANRYETIAKIIKEDVENCKNCTDYESWYDACCEFLTRNER